MKALEPCCDKLREGLEVDAMKEGGIHVNEDGTIDVLGCCGGGCNVLSNVKFCPFCGKRLKLTLGTYRHAEALR